MRGTIVSIAVCGLVVIGLTAPSGAQNFDGTWSGTTGCPAFLDQRPWSAPATATIVQNQFRFERNLPGVYELTQGMVRADGFVSASGQGERRDRPIAWNTRFSGRATASVMELTGIRFHGRPCFLRLSNTRPAAYSSAGMAAAHEAEAAAYHAQAIREAERQAPAIREADRQERKHTSPKRVARTSDARLEAAAKPVCTASVSGYPQMCKGLDGKWHEGQ